MEISLKTRKLIYSMFDKLIEGADKYTTTSSMWLIFTDEKRWVLEFTNTKTLWFNYHLFQSELALISMDCVDNKELIKEWFESRFLDLKKDEFVKQKGFRKTRHDDYHFNKLVEDTIKIGVDNIIYDTEIDSPRVDDTIQNGVKETTPNIVSPLISVIEKTIQNGVKETNKRRLCPSPLVEDAIQNGVKDTFEWVGENWRKVDETIQNGVKKTPPSFKPRLDQIEDTIQNGVKDTLPCELPMDDSVEKAIQNGVKDTQSCHWIHDIYVDDTIQNGVKNTHHSWHVREGRVDNVIQNGVKKTGAKMVESYEQKDHMVTNSIITEKINDAIKNGVRKIYGMRNMENLEVRDAIKNGVKS